MGCAGMKNPHPILTYMLTLLACGSIGVRTTLAQDQPNQRYFTLNQIDAFVEIESQFDQVRVRNDGRGRFGGDRRQVNRDWRVEERLGFFIPAQPIETDQYESQLWARGFD